MTVRILAFTGRGFEFAQRLAERTGGSAERCGPGSLSGWTERAFFEADALIFIGAAGIAVRAVAPFVKSKTSDPAVLVVDETGKFVVPILGGHIGGANELAEELANALGAVAVITTATDRNDLFAVDVWAAKQGCAIPNPERIKAVSAKLLRGECVRFYSEFPVSGQIPEGVVPGSAEDCDFALTIHRVNGSALACVPKIVKLGIGCRKNTPKGTMEARVLSFLEKNRLETVSVRSVCTIDVKKDEPGLIALCENHGWQTENFSADELRAVPGVFSASAFVQKTVGVDNVCERSAVLASGGRLIVTKDAADGVTVAAAVCGYFPAWE